MSLDQEHLSTPTVPYSSSVYHVSAMTAISAPASTSTVLAVLLNPNTWPEWNAFIPKVHILENPDQGNIGLNTRMIFETQMSPPPAKPVKTKISVTMFEKPTDGEAWICWVFKSPWLPKWMLFAERMHHIRDRPESEGGVEVITWENFRGFLAYIIMWMQAARLQSGFERWVQGLKEYVERQGRPTEF